MLLQGQHQLRRHAACRIGLAAVTRGVRAISGRHESGAVAETAGAGRVKLRGGLSHVLPAASCSSGCGHTQLPMRGLQRHDMNALHRAGRNAQVAAGAFVTNHGMHLLGRTHDGVHRAGLNAQGAANADLFVDYHHGFFGMLAVLGVQRLGVTAQQVGEGIDGASPPGGHWLMSASPAAMASA